MTTAELEVLAKEWIENIGRGNDERCVAELLKAVQLSKINDTLQKLIEQI